MTLGSQLGGRWLTLAVLAAALVCLPLAGCGSGSDGAPGANGLPGSSTGLLTGVVTNGTTGQAMSGVTVAIDPDMASAPVTTDASGAYSVELPTGPYTMTVAHSGYTTQTQDGSIVADGTCTMNFALVPASPVVVTITGVPSDPTPGSTMTLTADVQIFDGSTATGYEWSQEGVGGLTEITGVHAPATIASPASSSTGVTLGTLAQYKDALRSWILTPERWDVLPISPHALDEGDATVLDVKVTTTSGTYDATATIHADLPFGAWTSGIFNVPVGLPVWMNGVTQASYNWALAKPGSSTASLTDATTINPYFTPDVPGKYTLTVTDIGAEQVVTLDFYAGNWTGGIDGIGADGLPTMNACAACHVGKPEWNESYQDWRRSGHAHIFSTNINAGGHYSTSCFPCHTVGYDPAVQNGGIDEATDYNAFLDHVFPGGTIHGDATNWSWTVANAPDTAKHANIQCENCHGPNDLTSGGHMLASARISVRADVCGRCHGEPPHHGRFQQWQESLHGDFEVATGEGTRTSCAKCHSAQGFLDWLPDGVVDTAPSANDVHPITCVVCHDPHYVGTVSGIDTDAPVRIQGDAMNLEAGFSATDVGKGAMCMTCHNGRRGLQNDSVGLDSPDRAPHQGPQSDVLMGQNAFFVEVGYRSPHSYITDTCVSCHMIFTPPPADLSQDLGGTNHSFDASTTVCSKCHGEFEPSNLEAAFDASHEEMKTDIEQALLAEVDALNQAGYSVDFGNGIVVTDVADIQSFALAESHGRSGYDITVGGVENATNLDATVILDGDGGTHGSLVSNTLFANVNDLNPTAGIGRSCWNYSLLEADRSKGFHNPGFVQDILVNTLNWLGALQSNGWQMIP